MRFFSLAFYTILFLLLPLMANAQETVESAPQVTDSIQKMIAKRGKYILETFASRKKIDIDYQKVEEYVTQNAEGYKQLMNRFWENPDSLNEEEAAMLYYGFAFTKDYTPENIDLNVKLLEAFNDKDPANAFTAYKKESKRTPVSLSLLMNTSLLAGKMGMGESKKKYKHMAMKMLSGIMASGTGYSKEKAIKVLYIADEYAIFRDLMGMSMTRHEFYENRYDRMTLDTGNDGESIILWFDTYLNHQKLMQNNAKNRKQKKNKK